MGSHQEQSKSGSQAEQNGQQRRSQQEQWRSLQEQDLEGNSNVTAQVAGRAGFEVKSNVIKTVASGAELASESNNKTANEASDEISLQRGRDVDVNLNVTEKVAEGAGFEIGSHAEQNCGGWEELSMVGSVGQLDGAAGRGDEQWWHSNLGRDTSVES